MGLLYTLVRVDSVVAPKPTDVTRPNLNSENQITLPSLTYSKVTGFTKGPHYWTILWIIFPSFGAFDNEGGYVLSL